MLKLCLKRASGSASSFPPLLSVTLHLKKVKHSKFPLQLQSAEDKLLTVDITNISSNMCQFSVRMFN